MTVNIVINEINKYVTFYQMLRFQLSMKPKIYFPDTQKGLEVLSLLNEVMAAGE